MTDKYDAQIRDGLYMIVSLMYAYVSYIINDFIMFAIVVIGSIMVFIFLREVF